MTSHEAECCLKAVTNKLTVHVNLLLHSVTLILITKMMVTKYTDGY